MESLRRAQSGTLTVYEYVTIVSPVTTSLPSLPAMTLHFPASTPLAGKSVYYGISNLNAQGGLVSFNTQGPGAIDGQTGSFAQVPTPITYEAGHKYTSVVYATGTAPGKVGATKIYVANAGNNTVTTYNADGTPTTTITAGLNIPLFMAVDAAGKLYVENAGNSTLTTYDANGTQIIAAKLKDFGRIAIDAADKIYVAHYFPGIVKTYKADGTPTKPTISAGLDHPTDVAVDAAGKIYVTSSVVVDAAGKIHLLTSDSPSSNNNTVTTYNADGTPTAPSILSSRPLAVAVDTAGKIYVLNGITDRGTIDTVTTYSPDGIATTPTIRAGLSDSKSIAVH